MEKDQQQNSKEKQTNETFKGDQPGQQPPSEQKQSVMNDTVNEQQKEKHSESSFPKQDNETLGTP